MNLRPPSAILASWLLLLAGVDCSGGGNFSEIKFQVTMIAGASADRCPDPGLTTRISEMKFRVPGMVSRLSLSLCAHHVNCLGSSCTFGLQCYNTGPKWCGNTPRCTCAGWQHIDLRGVVLFKPTSRDRMQFFSDHGGRIHFRARC